MNSKIDLILDRYIYIVNLNFEIIIIIIYFNDSFIFFFFLVKRFHALSEFIYSNKWVQYVEKKSFQMMIIKNII